MIHESRRCFRRESRPNAWIFACSRKRWANFGPREARAEEAARKVERVHGGRLIATLPSGRVRIHEWECANAHRFKMRLFEVERGRWCPECDPAPRRERTKAIAPPRGLPEWVMALLKKRNGERVGDPPGDDRAPIAWRCANHHIFSLSVRQLKRGRWCEKCRDGKAAAPVVAEAKRQLEKNGGECLEDLAGGIHALIPWRCREGHRFTLTISQIRNGDWCEVCEKYETFRPSIAEAERLAREHAGTFLGSVAQIANDRPYRWRCDRGHEFNLAIDRVRQGYWCRKCYPYGISSFGRS